MSDSTDNNISIGGGIQVCCEANNSNKEKRHVF